MLCVVCVIFGSRFGGSEKVGVVGVMIMWCIDVVFVL